MEEPEELAKEMKVLNKEKLVAYRHMKEMYELIEDLRNTLDQHMLEYAKWREKFEKVDRELAEVDGRFKKVPLGEKKSTNPLDRLSKEQVLEIARELEDKRKEVV